MSANSEPANAESGADEPVPFDLFRRAEALLEQRRPIEALRALEPLVEENPRAPSVHLLRARAYFLSAQLRRAEASFRTVIELDPADHYARFALGRTLQRQGRLLEAQAQLRLAATMHPSPEYQDTLHEIRASLILSGDDSAN